MPSAVSSRRTVGVNRFDASRPRSTHDCRSGHHRAPQRSDAERRKNCMRTHIRPSRLALAAATALALLVPMLAPTQGHAAVGESLSVNLASTRGPATGVGEGFLYGFSEDGTQPADQYIQPLGINAFRGGGWFSGGWIKDNYQLGSATQADINSILAEAS